MNWPEQPAAMPDRFEHLAFERFWLQPMDGPDREAMDALVRWAADVPELDLVGSWVHGTGLAAVVAGVERTVGRGAGLAAAD